MNYDENTFLYFSSLPLFQVQISFFQIWVFRALGPIAHVWEYCAKCPIALCFFFRPEWRFSLKITKYQKKKIQLDGYLGFPGFGAICTCLGTFYHMSGCRIVFFSPGMVIFIKNN